MHRFLALGALVAVALGVSVARAQLNLNIVPFDAASSFSMGTAPPAANMTVWLRADSIVGLANGAAIATWFDTSGNNNNATQVTAANRPTYQTNVANGPWNSSYPPGAASCTACAPVVRFTAASSQFFNLPSTSSYSAGEAFIVVKITTDPPTLTNNTGLWRFTDSNSSDGYPATAYPWTDDKIYEGFGTTVRKGTGIGGIDHSAVGTLTQWRVYDVYSAGGGYQIFLGGVSLFSTASNTVQFSATPTLGQSHGGTGDGGLNYYLNGDVGEFILYNQVLSAADRQLVFSYLVNKFGMGPASGNTLSCPLNLNDSVKGQPQIATRDCDPVTTDSFAWPFMWTWAMPLGATTIRFDMEASTVVDNTQCTASGAPLSCCTGSGTGSCTNQCFKVAIGCGPYFVTVPLRNMTWGAYTPSVCAPLVNVFSGYTLLSFPSVPIPSTATPPVDCNVLVTRDGTNAGDTSPGVGKVASGRLMY